MANTTITKLPDAYCQKISGEWTAWERYSSTGSPETPSAFRFLVDSEAESAFDAFQFSSPSVSLNYWVHNPLGPITVTLYCSIYNRDPRVYGTDSPVAEQSKSITNATLGAPLSFSFSNLNTSGPGLFFVFEGLFTSVQVTEISATYDLLPLSVSISPTSLYAGEDLTFRFTNRSGVPLTVNFSTSATILDRITAESDEITFVPPDSWFDAAGVTAGQMTVYVSVADQYGRAANGQFILRRHFGSKASPIAPRSARFEGANVINFAWSVDETNGAQTEAQLQWSTDNAIWETLATVEGSETTWPAPRVKFPPGTIYWRVRIKNEFDLWGTWSNAASFTVVYAATAMVVPVDSPTSGVINAQVSRIFSVMLEASGASYEPFTIERATFYWRARSAGPYTALTMEPNADRASVLIPAGTFPSGSVTWYAEATDNTGRTTTTDVFTLSTLGAEVEAIPVSPIDTVESGSSTIVFRWDYGSIDESPQKSAQLQKSSDSETWEDLVTVTGSAARSYEAAAETFAAGLTYWRIRATSQNDVTGPWSRAVSFIAFAAPLVQGVWADSMPFVTVTWQVNSQLAFEIDIDGQIYGDYGANARTYTWPEPLQPGAHSVKVRAQNQYGLWSEWVQANFYTSEPRQMIALSGIADESAHLTWTGGEATMPVITVQPVDMWATEGLLSFSVDAVGEGLSFQWFMLEPGASTWNALGPAGPYKKTYTEPAHAQRDGYRFRCRVISAAGVVESDAATFHFEAPAAPPVIMIQPEDVFQKTGTVYICCGADGTQYEWYRRSAESLSPGLQVMDENGTLWHIPYGDVSAGAQRITDGSDDNWYFPAGEGEDGAVAITNGAGTWHLVPGPGESTPEWQAMGVDEPFIMFQADMLRSGEQFFCRVKNEVGSTDSLVAVYLYEDPPIEEGGSGDYYVYRDGVLLDRTTQAHYEDRTALGEHTYVVLNRLSNNNAARSNALTLSVAVGCLTIGLLSGGPWRKLRWSDRENRELTLTRSREVRWTHYAGAKYPEADVGEAEDLVGSFDAAWLAQNREDADAFEALIGEEVVVKTPRGVVVVGVLAGYDRRDPRFYKSYSFEVRQDDWGGRVDA